jgi:hypothetical protein
MRLHRRRGNTMALYAMFIVCVGIPLLMLTVDLSRAWLASVQLRGTTLAACQAYAHSIDIRAFQTSSQIKFKGDAYAKIAYVVARSSPKNARVPLPVVQILNSGDSRVVIVRCTGTASVVRIIGFGSFTVTSSAVAKVKLGTDTNW